MTMNGAHQNGWREWSKHVLKEQERQAQCLDQLKKDFNDFRVKTEKSLTRLNVQAAFVASVASLVVSGLVALIVHLLIK